jgi:alkanesulfonate monooxygenase SsuD/methylene tetrahydromethanopterin reductase-like flavin-dependent oxidoreductase (luciferase family)
MAPMFGWMMGAVGADGESDASMYRQMLSDAELGHRLGYDAAWVVEHHFSDYYPTPSPIALLANIAARCPGFGLGTAVLVTPWHHPVRLAEEIAMLSLMTDGPLRIGLGRGNAPMEYEAFNVPMDEAKDRFEECWDILRLALAGKKFSYHGRHLQVPREVMLRPTPRRDGITFFGAIGQPASAVKMARMGFPPMLTGHGPLELQRRILASWTETTRELGGDTEAPKLACPIMVMAETDREAEALARHYVPRWYQLQVEHYAFDAERHANVAHYESFAETHKRRRVYCDPANLDPLIEQSLIGGPATVRRKVQRLLDIGYSYILVQPSIPSVPGDVRQDWLTRFGRDVMPEFLAGARPVRASA